MAVSTPAEAVRAMCSQFKGFRDMFCAPGARYAVLVGETNIPMEGIYLETSGQPIHFVPVIEGAGGGNGDNFKMILLGAAIVAATVATAGGTGFAAFASGSAFKAGFAAAGSSFFGSMALGMGMSLMLGGVVNIISPAPRLNPNSSDSLQSKLFSGPANTTVQGHAIQICYGELEIGSAVLATMMDYDEGGGGSGTGHGGGYGAGHNNMGPSDGRDPDYEGDYRWDMASRDVDTGER